ncbi:MAG: hypothetical protein BWY82_00581 [Verrucomicrobia bacterium ADurb.Bin474]|nr:MAG: hypothetical protein BWY82_00581 [Verrucomicrobia bacterium ADurb.Bin474]
MLVHPKPRCHVTLDTHFSEWAGDFPLGRIIGVGLTICIHQRFDQKSCPRAIANAMFVYQLLRIRFA